jgi:hypothetical protein
LSSLKIDESAQVLDINIAKKLVGYLACSPSFQTEAIQPNLSTGEKS